MKYAVLGSAGQLGRDLCPRLPGEVLALTRQEADLTKPDALRDTLLTLRPDVVVNCAAYNLVDQAETAPDTAFAVNAWGVRRLAEICRDLEITLAHFSTDYVFGLDSSRQTPYAENEAPGPVSVYGMSKLCGEYGVRATCPQHHVIRTCGLYGVWGTGGKGTNFVETMLRLAGEGKPLRVVADQFCTPSSTADIAAASVPLLATRRFGLYHLTNTGSCSWYEFAAAIFELSGLKPDLQPTTSREFVRPARRPPYSVLSLGVYENLGLPRLRSWREALADYLEVRRRK